MNIKDLLQPSAPAEDRRLALHFLACLVKGQVSKFSQYLLPEDIHAVVSVSENSSLC